MNPMLARSKNFKTLVRVPQKERHQTIFLHLFDENRMIFVGQMATERALHI